MLELVVHDVHQRGDPFVGFSWQMGSCLQRKGCGKGGGWNGMQCAICIMVGA